MFLTRRVPTAVRRRIAAVGIVLVSAAVGVPLVQGAPSGEQPAPGSAPALLAFLTAQGGCAAALAPPAFPYDGVERALPRCRRGLLGTYDIPALNGGAGLHDPAPACGLATPLCQPAAFGAGNARIRLDLTTGATQAVTDSFGTVIARVRRNGGPGCYDVLRADGTRFDTTCKGDAARDASFEVQGRACMATGALESANYLAILQNPGPESAGSGLHGFVSSSAFSPEPVVAERLEAAYVGCGSQPFPLRTGVPVTLGTSGLFDPAGDRYVGTNSYAACGQAAQGDSTCGGPLANYQGPEFATGFAPLAIATTGVSGVNHAPTTVGASAFSTSGGGVVRAIVPRGRPLGALQYDEIATVDANVPCGQRRVAKWIFVAGNPGGDAQHKMLGWTPKRVPVGEPRRC